MGMNKQLCNAAGMLHIAYRSGHVPSLEIYEGDESLDCDELKQGGSNNFGK